MSYKKLQSAALLYGRLKELDQEIIALDKLAILVAEKPCSIVLSLSIVDIEKQKKEEVKVQFDEHGSLKTGTDNMYRSLLSGYSFFTTRDEVEDKSKNYTESYSQAISDTNTLQVLGVILCEKQTQRALIIDEIKSLNLI